MNTNATYRSTETMKQPGDSIIARGVSAHLRNDEGWRD
jgi:hypothetical protein